MNDRLKHRVTLEQREGFGHLRFPRLRQEPYMWDEHATMADLAVGGGKTSKQRKSFEKKTSKSMRKLNERLAGTAEYRQARHNVSYKWFFDMLGDFPLHPEYLYVMEAICTYYGTTIIDIESHLRRSTQAFQYSKDRPAPLSTNPRLMDCAGILLYFLINQYKCNPYVISQFFSVSLAKINNVIGRFCKDFEKSFAVRADYEAIYRILLDLQPKYDYHIDKRKFE